MAKIIAVAQLKGGVGKSTITTNLAGSLAAKHRVALIDADLPQGTSSRWAVLRQDPNIQLIAAETAQVMTTAVDSLDNQVDYVVIDLPPRSLKFLRETLAFADLVLMPVLASAADVWATEELVAIVREARKGNKRLRARLVWNRLRASRLTAKFLDEAAAELRSKELDSMLCQRTVYAEALGVGKTVEELKDAKAAAEWRIMMRELIKQLDK
jgi:chromosome partitioning protein